MPKMMHFITLIENHGKEVLYSERVIFYLYHYLYMIGYPNTYTNKYLCANISSAIRSMEGNTTIGILRQYYLLVISTSIQVI